MISVLRRFSEHLDIIQTSLETLNSFRRLNLASLYLGTLPCYKRQWPKICTLQLEIATAVIFLPPSPPFRRPDHGSESEI